MEPDIYNDGRYLQANPTWHSEDSQWKAQHLFSLLRRDIPQAWRGREITIAEVGCGFGGVLAGLTSLLQDAGVKCRARGYDIAKDAIAEASRRHDRIDFVHGSIEQDAQCYDLILVVDVLEHLEQPAHLLQTVLSRSQWVAVHLPLDRNVFARLYHGSGYFEHLRATCGHLHYFTRRDAVRMMAAVGGDVVRWKYTPWGIELDREGAGRIIPFVRRLRVLGMQFCPAMTVRLLGGASLACLCRASRVNHDWPVHQETGQNTRAIAVDQALRPSTHALTESDPA